jgi:hypothetical protein
MKMRGRYNGDAAIRHDGRTRSTKRHDRPDPPFLVNARLRESPGRFAVRAVRVRQDSQATGPPAATGCYERELAVKNESSLS